MIDMPAKPTSNPHIVGIAPYRFQPMISRDIIQSQVDQLGATLRKDYEGKQPIVIGVLNGCFIFMADLVRAMNISCEVDFIKLSSYRDGMRPGEITLLKDVDADLAGRHVILVEDIVDSGKSLGFLRQHLMDRKPASLVMAAMFMKHCFKASGQTVEYVGMEIPDEFVVGYGLDYAQQWRQLPDLFVLVQE
jgi:hypoxanthine phosphoribosyltransferase